MGQTHLSRNQPDEFVCQLRQYWRRRHGWDFRSHLRASKGRSSILPDPKAPREIEFYMLNAGFRTVTTFQLGESNYQTLAVAIDCKFWLHEPQCKLQNASRIPERGHPRLHPWEYRKSLPVN